MIVRTHPVLAALAAWLLGASPAAAGFTGDLAFTPDACMAENQCVLKSPLTFVDRAERTWRADAGAITDGASIPDWAQSVIGGRWDESYLKAAVLHDQYCDSMRYPWSDTHLMFYEALIALGVNSLKAKVMYYAVYLAGPKWESVLVAPKCGPEDACVMARDVDGAVMLRRPDRYRSMDMHDMMADAERYVAGNPDASLQDLEDMARRARPNDAFLQADAIARSQAPD